MSHIAEQISRLRKEKGLTQAQLAERLHVTRQTVSNYENGKSEPDLDMLAAIAAALDTDTATLLGMSPSPAPMVSKRKQRNRLFLWAALLAVAWVIIALLADSAEVYMKTHFGGRWTIVMLAYDARLLIPMLAGLLLGRCWLTMSDRTVPQLPWVKALHIGLCAIMMVLCVMFVVDLADGIYVDVLYHQQRAQGQAVIISHDGFLPFLSNLRWQMMIVLTRLHALGTLPFVALGFGAAVTKPN